MAYNRYKYLIKSDGTGMDSFPPIKIKRRIKTDMFRTYNPDKTRLDRISYEVYGENCWGFLILLANPEYAIEFDIPKGTVLRVPMPLREVLTEYEGKVLRLKEKS